MNGLLVSNTDPIIALAGIARLELLRSILFPIFVPDAVNDEIRRGRDNESALAAIDAASWIQTRNLSRGPDRLLLRTLDIGEASVIALALETQANWVLIDERKGRKIASEIYGLRVIGTAGLLVHAKRRGLLPSVKTPLSAMRRNGYWLHEAIMSWALREAGEK